MASEMDAESVELSLNLGSAFTSLVSSSNISKHLKEQQHKIQVINDLKQFKPPQAEQPKDVDLAVKLYHALDEANIL